MLGHWKREILDLLARAVHRLICIALKIQHFELMGYITLAALLASISLCQQSTTMIVKVWESQQRGNVKVILSLQFNFDFKIEALKIRDVLKI